MAAITQLGAAASTTDGTTIVDGPRNPTAGALLFVLVIATATASPGRVTTDAAGQSYSLVGNAVKAASADRLYLFVGNFPATTVNQSVTFRCNDDAHTGAVLHFGQVTGLARFGQLAIRQFGKQDNGSAAGTPTIPFVVPALTGNPVASFVANATNPAGVTVPAGFTDRSNTGYATPTTGSRWASIDSGHTAANVTWGGTSATAYGALAVEFDTSGSPITAKERLAKMPLPMFATGPWERLKLPGVGTIFAAPTAPGGSTVTLDASIAGQGALTADFVRNPLVLAADLAGTGSVAANFVRDKLVLEAAIAGLGLAGVDLAVTHTLEALISGTSSVTATLEVLKLLDAVIAGTGAVAADFVRDRLVLNAAIAGTGTVTANVVLNVALAAVLSGTGTVTANFVRDKLVFQVDVAGLGTLAADITVTGGATTLEAAIAGVAAVSPSLVTALVLQAAINGQGTLGSDLTVSRPETPGGDLRDHLIHIITRS